MGEQSTNFGEGSSYLRCYAYDKMTAVKMVLVRFRGQRTKKLGAAVVTCLAGVQMYLK